MYDIAPKTIENTVNTQSRARDGKILYCPPKTTENRANAQLLASQYNSDGTDGANNKWINLLINEIEFGAENEDDEIYCAKFNLTITNTNQF